MANTATRLITLIMLLQRRSNQKAQALAAELGVSTRTLHRYIGMLEEMGIPVLSARGPQGGFSLMRGYKMPPLMFTPQEAVALYLGTSLVREMWGDLYRDAAQGALAKLDNVLPDEQQQEIAWARETMVATGMQFYGNDGMATHLSHIRRAIQMKRKIGMAYRSRNQPRPSQRVVAPYALVYRWGWWYVVGHCNLRDAVRSFRIDRITDLALLDESFEVPPTFDVHQFLATELQSQPQITVRLRFLPAAAHVAEDGRFMWQNMDEQPDGSMVVSFETPNLDWALSMVLGYGGGVVVLAPVELRQKVAEEARIIAAHYQKEI